MLTACNSPDRRVFGPIDRVLLASNKTCCVCRDRGRPVSIFALNDNGFAGCPSLHSVSHEIVLCRSCHAYFRKREIIDLRPRDLVLREFNEEWLDRIRIRREQADSLVMTRLLAEQPKVLDGKRGMGADGRGEHLIRCVNRLPGLRWDLMVELMPDMNSGVTSRILSVCHRYVDVLEAIMVALSRFYAPGTFGATTEPRAHFVDHIAMLFEWHRGHLQPFGARRAQGSVRVVCAGNVIADLEAMIEDMVMSLVGNDIRFNFSEWPKRWRQDAGAA